MSQYTHQPTYPPTHLKHSAIFVRLTTHDSRPPSSFTYSMVLAVSAFLMCSAWIYTIATELVAVVTALGLLWSIPSSLLGLTLLAWGNSAGDLITNIAVAVSGWVGGLLESSLLSHIHPTYPPTHPPTHLSIKTTACRAERHGDCRVLRRTYLQPSRRSRLFLLLADLHLGTLHPGFRPESLHFLVFPVLGIGDEPGDWLL